MYTVRFSLAFLGFVFLLSGVLTAAEKPKVAERPALPFPPGVTVEFAVWGCR